MPQPVKPASITIPISEHDPQRNVIVCLRSVVVVVSAELPRLRVQANPASIEPIPRIIRSDYSHDFEPEFKEKVVLLSLI
jgi:hypothetical protein